MNALNVRIIQLDPLRVASFHAYGEQPEDPAWEKLTAWAELKGILDNLDQHRIFGFNNPSPSPGSPNYGYEFWITVGSEVQPEGELEIKQFPGGLYAVARCEAGDRPYETIPACWEQLALWREDSLYESASHQWLEEHFGLDQYLEGQWTLDLYLPIEESGQ